MNMRELIERAAAKMGTNAALAQGLGMHQNRLSEWKRGTRKPEANEIAYLASVAGLPVLETVAEIEAQLDDRFTAVWREALGKLKAAGVAAVLVLASLPHQEARAGVLQLQDMHSFQQQNANMLRSLRRAAGRMRAWMKALICSVKQPSHGPRYTHGCMRWHHTWSAPKGD